MNNNSTLDTTILSRLQAWHSDLGELTRQLPELLRKLQREGDYSLLKKVILLKANQRYDNWSDYHKHPHNSIRQQVFRNDALWGQVGELLDFWFTLQATGKKMKPNKNKKGIDFLTEFGAEDTKWSLKRTNSFPIEITSRGNPSHHWNYVAEGTNVFLRFINAEGCFRIKLSENMKSQPLVNFRGQTTYYDCPIKNFEKVWEWQK